MQDDRKSKRRTAAVGAPSSSFESVSVHFSQSNTFLVHFLSSVFLRSLARHYHKLQIATMAININYPPLHPVLFPSCTPASLVWTVSKQASKQQQRQLLLKREEEAQLSRAASENWNKVSTAVCRWLPANDQRPVNALCTQQTENSLRHTQYVRASECVCDTVNLNETRRLGVGVGRGRHHHWNECTKMWLGKLAAIAIPSAVLCCAGCLLYKHTQHTVACSPSSAPSS